MSVTNEGSSRLRSWFQFTSKSSNTTSNTTSNTSNNTTTSNTSANTTSHTRSDDENSRTDTECQQQSSNTLLDRVTSFRRSLGKAQNRKNKIRPTSAKGLTSAVEQQNIAKSKNTSTTRKPSSPTATSGGSASSVNCDDDEIYGFTSANFDCTNNSTRRQLKSSFNAPNISAYESEANKSGRVRNEDQSHPNANLNSNIASTCKGVSQDSPEWLKADAEFSFYHQQNQHSFDSRDPIGGRLYYYQHQYFQDGDINMRHSSTQHLSWTEPLNSEPDDIDRIYENMRGLSAAVANTQQRLNNHRNTSFANNNNNNSYVNSNVNNTSETVSNNRKLTKDSGYESASTSISNWAQMNPNANALSNNYFHSRSDSNASSVSTGGSLSPRTAGSSAKSAYHYSEPWSTAKSTSNLPLQVQVCSNSSGTRRSSLSGASNAYSESVINTGKSVLPAKSVPGNLDRDSDENLIRKRSHNRNNPTPSSVYSLLASKSGFDFAPVRKPSRKSCGSSFSENPFVAKYNERILTKGSDSNSSQLWKAREKNSIQTCGQEERYSVTDDSPPPTPPVRDSSLASNRKFNLESQQHDAQNKLTAESISKANETSIHDRNLGQTAGTLYYKNNSSQYYMQSYSENRVSHIGYSKSLINLRSKYDESSDLKQFSQTYPLLPEAEFNDKQIQESWSCDQSVTSGVTSLVTSSDYFTASSSVMTHSPSLSSLNTTGTNTTTASYNNSRNSISSTSSSSQIARSAKVLQPKRQESASVLYYEKPPSDSAKREREIPPPPPPPKLHFSDYDQTETSSRSSSTSYGKKMVSVPRSVDHSSAQSRSDSEIKAIQKRALYQFYLKQKQKEKQENSSNAKPAANEDTSQVPSRKVQLVVHENIYQNTNAPSPPSPPLPSPPPPLPDIELIGDLPLPPPPSPPITDCERESATISTHSISQKVSITDSSYPLAAQQLTHAITPPIELVSHSRAADVVSHKSEIATQTTETLRRNSGCNSAKEITQSNKVSLETSEPMYQNEVPTTGKQSPSNKSMESVESDKSSVAPWAYSKLWPDEKCAKTTHYDNDSRECYLSNNASSPITAANDFIGDTGVSFSSSNEDLLANKSELISRLTRKLDVLRSEEMALSQDIESNETLGLQMKSKLKSLGITAQESEKINLHCDETEKVTRLLLSISARLQQIDSQINEKSSNPKFKIHQNSVASELLQQSSKQSISQNDSDSNINLCQNDLQQIADNHSSYSSNLFDEMQSLVMKREKLLIQLEEALQLRVSIDNRSLMIEEKILKKYFKDNSEHLNEFIEFIRLKSKLIVDIRQVRDKIQLGEKRLYALKTS